MRSFFMSARTGDQINDCFIQIASELSGVKTILSKSIQKGKNNPSTTIQEEDGVRRMEEDGEGRREEEERKERREEGGGRRREEEGREEGKKDDRPSTGQNKRKTVELGNKQFGLSQNRENERKSVSANMPQRKLMTEKGRESKGSMSDINKMTMEEIHGIKFYLPMILLVLVI